MRYYTMVDNGKPVVICSKLSLKEVMDRSVRLSHLIALTEGYEDGVGNDIFKKAYRAYNKVDGFTGIIRLSMCEKDFIGYMLEGEFIDDEDKSCLSFYLKN